MVFLQQQGLPTDAQGRITLGPLECVETSKLLSVQKITLRKQYLQIHKGMSSPSLQVNRILKSLVGERET